MQVSDALVFDRRLLRARRDRAAAGLGAHDFLFREVADRLADRLDDVRRTFPVALDLGCHTGVLAGLGVGGFLAAYHLLPLEDPCEIFPTQYIDVKN